MEPVSSAMSGSYPAILLIAALAALLALLVPRIVERHA